MNSFKQWMHTKLRRKLNAEVEVFFVWVLSDGIWYGSGWLLASCKLLGCDFVSLHTNTQIRIRRFSNVQRFFHLCNRLLCVFSVKNMVLLVNTQIHITKWPGFYSSIHKKLFVAQIYVPRGTFFCATNKILQIHKRLIIAFFATRNCRNPIFVSTWNLLPLVE